MLSSRQYEETHIVANAPVHPFEPIPCHSLTWMQRSSSSYFDSASGGQLSDSQTRQVGPSPVCSSVRLGHNDYADSGAWGRISGITVMLDCAPEKNHPRGACPRKIFAAASPQAEKSPQLAQSVQRRRQNWKKARKMLRKFGPFLGWRRRNGAVTARIGP